MVEVVAWKSGNPKGETACIASKPCDAENVSLRGTKPRSWLECVGDDVFFRDDKGGEHLVMSKCGCTEGEILGRERNPARG